MTERPNPDQFANSFRMGPDEDGRFGIHGGRFVAETLMPLILDLQGEWERAKGDETFWAEKSRGAWLHDGRLRVSNRRNLDDALLATGIPFQGAGNASEWTKVYNALGPKVAGIRRFGAASLDLAWVAAGRYDGFWESGLSPWDTAAGCLLVREAGGFVSDFRGRSLPIADKQVLAGNDTIHSKMHKLLAEALKG